MFLTNLILIFNSHILYAFANVRPESGEVFLSDKWADEEIHYDGDSWDDTGTNLYGNFKQLYLLKKTHRHLKLLLSIGGWTYSKSFHPVVVSPAHRTRFVHSAIRILEDYGLDGLDIDYEYPASQAQGQGLADLVTALRSAFTSLQQRKGDSQPYQITIAAGAGPSGYTYLNIAQMDAAISYWNLMVCPLVPIGPPGLRLTTTSLPLVGL